MKTVMIIAFGLASGAARAEALWAHVEESLIIDRDEGNLPYYSIYKATGDILCRDSVVSENTINVIFRAPQINLKPGFHAEAGAKFTAKPIEVFDIHFVEIFETSGKDHPITGTTPGNLIEPDDFVREVENPRLIKTMPLSLMPRLPLKRRAVKNGLNLLSSFLRWKPSNARHVNTK